MCSVPISALLAFLGTTAISRADVNLYETVCFGDSLTDNQSILPWYTGMPASLYGHDPMELVWEKNRQPGNELSNYATAGFTTDLVDLQVELYEFNTFFGFQPRATLFQLEMGGNDLLGNESLLTRYAPGANQQADEVINNIIRNWRNYVQDLREDARHDAKAVFWTIPDIGLTPRYYGQFNAEEHANLRAHTERANAVIRSFARFSNVVVLDVFNLISEWSLNPPVIRDIILDLPPDYGESDDFFADDIHPTAVSNALLANELIDLMNLKWDASFAAYTEDELYDFAINGGWVPAPSSALALAGMLIILTPRRRRPGASAAVGLRA